MSDNYNDSYEYIEDDFIENDSSENSSFFPPREYILILTFFLLILLIIFEKVFKAIFLFFIPSKFFLIIAMIILNLFFIRYIIVTAIFIGRNSIIKFYFRAFVAKKKAKLLIKYFTNFNAKIDKILNMKIKENQNPKQFISKSKIIQRYIDIYNNVQNNYGKISSYSQNFYDHLITLKNKIDNSPLKDIYEKIEKNEEIIINEENKNILSDIKDEVEKIKNKLIVFRESKSLCPNILNIKNIIYNDILQSPEFTRESILLKKENTQKITINTKDDTNLDCLLITSDNQKETGEIKSKNLIIVCGPNLIPFDNLIASWDIDTMYTNNKIDLLFWNYRGYGFSEGSADFDNICNDVLSVYDFVLNNYTYNSIGVYGFSIGGIASCYLAKNRAVNLLIADRTFNSTFEILEQVYLGKYIAYLGKILFISFVDNTNNYLSAKCNKIILNDVQDQIIKDSISLKTSICKNMIYKIFNETNIEFNIRNLKSKNIIDYALEPEQSEQMYSAFKYIISFLKIKNQRKINDSINLYDKKIESEKSQRLNEDNQNNIEIINSININVKDILDKMYEKIKTAFSNFFCPDNSFEYFLDYQSKKVNFHNYFNSLVIYGPESVTLKHYFKCDTKFTEKELNIFISEIDDILNNEEYIKISQNILYQKLKDFNESLKNLKIYVAGLNIEEIENKWMKPIKGVLIPLNCGHTSFYYEDSTINTLIFLIKEAFNNTDSIAIENDPPLIE